ncbi:universal stress protein [Streptomyces sp. NPDC086766]|uniref:universal stress protein n=1 Tax=Streptomyces sp. NPDC086766 TaxID=3365754 RepID=UPI00380F3B22
MAPQPLPRTAAVTSPVRPLSLPRPVTALLTGSVQDIAVVDTAVRLAAPRRAPLLLIAALPDHAQSPTSAKADAIAARVVLGRVLPRVRDAGLEHISVAHRNTLRGTRLRAAGAVLDVAARHQSSVVAAATRGPAGLDAHTLTEASALRCGPFVHSVTRAEVGPLPPVRLRPTLTREGAPTPSAGSTSSWTG